MAQLSIWSKKDSSGTRQVAGVVYSDSTANYSASLPMFSSYYSLVAMFRANPANGEAWTAATIAGSEF